MNTKSTMLVPPSLPILCMFMYGTYKSKYNGIWDWSGKWSYEDADIADINLNVVLNLFIYFGEIGIFLQSLWYLDLFALEQQSCKGFGAP
jgi:hypothetical protein